MFKPSNKRIGILNSRYTTIFSTLDKIFDKKSIVYVDYANVSGWYQKLRWTTDIRRLGQLLRSYDTVQSSHFYYGTLMGDQQSETTVNDAQKYFTHVHTKEVKLKHLSIDSSSISPQSPDLLKQFIKRCLLTEFSLSEVEYLNAILKRLNNLGKTEIEDKKCNFDVELAIQMRDDLNNHHEVDNFVLWSGDCDFEEPVKMILNAGKKVTIFAPRGHIASELAQSGATIFETRPLKNILCWPRQMDIAVKKALTGI